MQERGGQRQYFSWRTGLMALTLTGFLSLPSAALAAGCSPNPVSPEDILACAREDYRKADSDLRTIYASLMGFLSPSEQKKLNEIELSWLQYRDLHCIFDADTGEDETMRTLLLTGCQTRLTEERIKNLYKLYEVRKPTKPTRSKPLQLNPKGSEPLF
jgi:uncharacterized protein YecT (DUF1311 family)